jgi:hypothetical protein
MDLETLPDEVLHQKNNDLERLRDPSHTHFPFPFEFGNRTTPLHVFNSSIIIHLLQ